MVPTLRKGRSSRGTTNGQVLLWEVGQSGRPCSVHRRERGILYKRGHKFFGTLAAGERGAIQTSVTPCATAAWAAALIASAVRASVKSTSRSAAVGLVPTSTMSVSARGGSGKDVWTSCLYSASETTDLIVCRASDLIADSRCGVPQESEEGTVTSSAVSEETD